METIILIVIVGVIVGLLSIVIAIVDFSIRRRRRNIPDEWLRPDWQTSVGEKIWNGYRKQFIGENATGLLIASLIFGGLIIVILILWLLGVKIP